MTKSDRLLPVHRLFGRTVKQFWQRKGLYLWIVAIVVVPFQAIGAVVHDDALTSATLNAFSTMAIAIFMNLALIYAIMAVRAGQPVKAKLAYYEASAGAVRFIVVCLLLSFMLIPAALGGFVYLVGSYAPFGLSGSIGELLLIGLVALMVTLPSAWLLVRFSLSVVAVAIDGSLPLVALRRSRELTLGRFWRVSGRLIVMLLSLLLIVVIAYIPSALLGFVVKDGIVLNAIYLAFFNLLAIPFINLYQINLYQDLARVPVVPKAKRVKGGQGTAAAA